MDELQVPAAYGAAARTSAEERAGVEFWDTGGCEQIAPRRRPAAAGGWTKCNPGQRRMLRRKIAVLGCAGRM